VQMLSGAGEVAELGDGGNESEIADLEANHGELFVRGCVKASASSEADSCGIFIHRSDPDHRIAASS
jgi:hypothetical protein